MHQVSSQPLWHGTGAAPPTRPYARACTQLTHNNQHQHHLGTSQVLRDLDVGQDAATCGSAFEGLAASCSANVSRSFAGTDAATNYDMATGRYLGGIGTDARFNTRSTLYNAGIAQRGPEWFNMSAGSGQFNPLSGVPYGGCWVVPLLMCLQRPGSP